MDSAILDEGGAKSGAIAIETGCEALPADLQLVALAWPDLSDEAKRNILAIVRREGA